MTAIIESERLIVELGVILGGTQWATGADITVTLPNQLVEEVMHAAIGLAPVFFEDDDGVVRVASKRTSHDPAQYQG
jgi:hypothetical protein